MWQPLKSKNITSKQESQPFRVASVIEKVGAGGLRNRRVWGWHIDFFIITATNSD